MLLAFAYFWLVVIIIGWLTIIIQCCYSSKPQFQKEDSISHESENLVSIVQESKPEYRTIKSINGHEIPVKPGDSIY